MQKGGELYTAVQLFLDVGHSMHHKPKPASACYEQATGIGIHWNYITPLSIVAGSGTGRQFPPPNYSAVR